MPKRPFDVHAVGLRPLHGGLAQRCICTCCPCESPRLADQTSEIKWRTRGRQHSFFNGMGTLLGATTAAPKWKYCGNRLSRKGIARYGRTDVERAPVKNLISR
jgi:hypothetical protein